MRTWLINSRKQADMTQRELANMVEISQNHYSAIENGDRRPSPKVSKRIAGVLGFDWTLFYEIPSEGVKRTI